MREAYLLPRRLSYNISFGVNAVVIKGFCRMTYILFCKVRGAEEDATVSGAVCRIPLASSRAASHWEPT
jgi:hypothetical protein